MDQLTKKRKSLARKRERARIGSLKGTKPSRNPDYLDFIRLQPCLICGAPSDPAHTGVRGLRQKASDYEAIPLCPRHHRRGYPESHHTLGKRFFDHHGIDREAVIFSLRNQYWDAATR